MPTHVHFSGGPSMMVDEDFDQVQRRLEHEAGLFTVSTGAETGHRISIHRSAVAYIEEIPTGEQAESPRKHTAAARRRAAST
jgi:phosphoserine aminotransferase